LFEIEAGDAAEGAAFMRPVTPETALAQKQKALHSSPLR
jgi:hypothetical protein